LIHLCQLRVKFYCCYFAIRPFVSVTTQTSVKVENPKRASGNMRLAQWRVKCIYVTVVVHCSSVFQFSFGADKPPHAPSAGTLS